MRARLRKKTLKVSMAQLLPRTLYLTTKVVGVSAFADAGTHPRIYLWPRSFLQLQIHAISVTLDYQLLDSHLWQTPLFYSMTIMSIINIGLQGLVYFLILIGWILVAGTFILCAIFLFLHNFLS
ncbi:uncharacterized protein LOC108344256 isoform X5 [Vigna angularis]|uniref:uncharacterized protein LOC108344256 isoform X5 n=1 Tax=Phaseolus angularis TaxID=3914 RepID=UPI0022B3F15F|nr:uncharacterized protein LOC108344256 isoform X5 [Vigna angularis]